MITLLLVEQPEAVRRALYARLSLEPDLAPIGEASDSTSAIGLAEALRPDVILLDAEMPDLDLRRAVNELRLRSPSSAIVIVSHDLTALLWARDAGAVTVVGKHQGIGALLGAIRTASIPEHPRACVPDPTVRP